MGGYGGALVFMLLVFLLFLIAKQTSAAIYRCQVDGKTIFSNVPCANGQDIGINEKRHEAQDDDNPSAPKRLKPLLKQHNDLETSRQNVLKALNSGQTEPAPALYKYDIDHQATERNGTVEISGRITGPQCDSLRVDAFARSSDGGIVECVTVTRLSGRSTLFSCTDRARRSKDGRNRDWFVSSIYTNCQD